VTTDFTRNEGLQGGNQEAADYDGIDCFMGPGTMSTFAADLYCKPV
jgi:hypothetical protein